MLLQIIWNPDREIINLFGIFSLRYYSVLFVTGLILGYLVVRWLYKKESLPLEQLEQLAIYVFIGIIAGARLGHCLFYEPGYYLLHPHEMILPFRIESGEGFKWTGYQGLASHGGAIGILTAIALYCRKNKASFLGIMDKIAIATPLTGAFIRMGNFMNSEIIGEPTNSGFGVIFQKIDMLPRHPSQLYEAFSYLVIFMVLILSYQRLRGNKDGFVFGFFLILLFTARFLIEFLKISQVDFENGMFLNMGQLLSLPFIVAGIVLMVVKRKLHQ